MLTACIWMYGGWLTLQGIMSTGDLIAFTAFTNWLFNPIFTLMASLSNLQVSLACTERVFRLLDEPIAMPDSNEAKDAEHMKEGIVFENVSFSYPDGTQAIDNINLNIPRGKVVALVGSSGSGKTTITNLIMRFYDVTSGTLMLDGQDIRELKLSSYRKLISTVLQDVFLFDGSIRENIAYGYPEASNEEVVSAATIANCHQFIMELDEGYETVVGERGVKLSGGQKQRIALARAIVTNPDILILDEATSALDSESEELIQQALYRIFQNRTSIVVAHRLSTIMDADKIVVFDNGKIIEEGNHEQLINKRGRYFELYTTQMKKDAQNGSLLELLNSRS
jgi:ABC-type multidrug transport system fused ATPase/permease subunit